MPTDAPLPPPTAPCILLTATLRWTIAARLAIAFAEMGCRVEVACPRQHPAATTRAIGRVHRYGAYRPLRSLRAAIESAAPDLVIACDDDAVIDLHRLSVHAGGTDAAQVRLRALIARSLGAPAACTLATARAAIMALAAAEGVCVPATAAVATAGELTAWLGKHGFPAVLKTDCSWGGQGVALVHDHAQAQRALAAMASPPSRINGLVRALLDRDPSVLLNALRRTRRAVTAQQFIAGRPANRAVVCWQGRVLAGISVEALRTQHPTGPATVVRVIENPAMSEAAQRLVRRLGISGFWGLDFVLETATGAVYLIEANPRATPVCHLPLGAGRNLPAALYAQLAATAPRTPPATVERDIIALFPGEWRRDPASAYLRSAYHDIPWDEPALVLDCIDRPWSERGLMARLWARMRTRPARSQPSTGGRNDAPGVPAGGQRAPDALTLNGVAADRKLTHM